MSIFPFWRRLYHCEKTELRDNMVKDKTFYKLFLTLTLTIALRNVITFTVNLADSVMLGAYSENALSGVALVNQVQFMLQLMVTGVCEGVQIFISRAWGAKDNTTIKKMINISIKCTAVIAVLVAVLAAVFPHGLLSLLSNEGDIVAEGAGYLKIILFSYLFFAVSTSLITALNGVETVRIGFVTSIMTLCINVALNYCLIFGHFGFPELGARGAAVATLCSRIVECAVILIYVRFVDKKICIRARDFGKINKSLFADYFKKGLPVFLSSFTWGLAMSIQLGILGHMGKSVVTANSIANTLFQIISVITYASASACTVIISKTIGEGRHELVKPYAKTFQVLFLIIGAATGAAIFALRGTIINFYNVSEEAKNLAVTFLTILSVTVVGTSYQMPCLTGLVRAGGDTSFVFKNDMIFMWCIVLPMSLIAAFYLKLSPAVVFICLKSDQITKCFVAVVKVNRFKWIKTLNHEAQQKQLSKAF